MRKASLFLILIACLTLTSTSAFAFPMVETYYTDFWWWDFHTYDYASKVDFYRWNGSNGCHKEAVPDGSVSGGSLSDGWLNGVWIGTAPDLPDYLEWAHKLPEDLGTVPPSQVTRAKLWIDGAYIDSDNNTVEIEGDLEWDPLNRYWFDNTTYWLTDAEIPGFWNDGSLDVKVTAGECAFRIDEAILMMDYTTTPIPEPGTLVLLGSGLLGLGIFNLKRKK